MFDVHYYLACAQQELQQPYRNIRVDMCDETWKWKGDKKYVYPPVEPQRMAADARNNVAKHIAFLKQQNSYNYGGYATPSSIEDAKRRTQQIEEEEKQLQKKAEDMIEEYAKLYPRKKEIFLYLWDLMYPKSFYKIIVKRNDSLDKLCDLCNEYPKGSERFNSLASEYESAQRFLDL